MSGIDLGIEHLNDGSNLHVSSNSKLLMNSVKRDNSVEKSLRNDDALLRLWQADQLKTGNLSFLLRIILL